MQVVHVSQLSLSADACCTNTLPPHQDNRVWKWIVGDPVPRVAWDGWDSSIMGPRGNITCARLISRVEIRDPEKCLGVPVRRNSASLWVRWLTLDRENPLPRNSLPNPWQTGTLANILPRFIYIPQDHRTKCERGKKTRKMGEEERDKECKRWRGRGRQDCTCGHSVHNSGESHACFPSLMFFSSQLMWDTTGKKNPQPIVIDEKKKILGQWQNPRWKFPPS